MFAGCRAEGEKIDDDIRDAKADMERATQEAATAGNAWKGKGKGLYRPDRPEGAQKGDADGEDDDFDAHYGEHECDDMDEGDEEEECQLWDEAFTEWLETREPSLYDLATNFFNWCPTPGMLDNCYMQYTKEATNANALRQVLAARARGDDMRQWQE